MKSFLWLWGFVFIFIACSKSERIEPATGSIAGSVSDKTTGEPVGTVSVSLSPGGQSTVTGSDGTFGFVELEAGEHTIVVRKEGYLSNENKFSVILGKQMPAHLLIERIPAVITTEPTIVDFGSDANVNTLSFKIVNRGYGDLAWEIEQNCPWIQEVKPKSGTLEFEKTGTIVVVIDRDLLTAGENKTVLVMKSTNGSSQVEVKAVGEERRLPVLNVLDATDVAATTAKLNAAVLDAGAPKYTKLGFVYDTLPEPSLERAMRKLSVALLSATQFDYSLDNLTLGKTYYVRAYAKNANGMVYSSNEISFTTQATLPEVSVQEATEVDVLNGSAILQGTVINAGDPCYVEKGFVYGTGMNPTVENNKVVVDGTAEGGFKTNLSVLPLEQLFYVRAYAVSVAGTVYSSDNAKVSTQKVLPEVTTQEATDTYVAAGMAVLHGTVVSAGSPVYTERGFVYGTTQAPTINDRKVVAEGSGSVNSFSCKVTDLPEGVGYVRAYATNSAGTVYGNVVTVKPTWIELRVNGSKIAVQREDIGMGSRAEMIEKCKNSKLEAYTDWRLPTKEELTVIYENREAIGGFCTQANSDKSYYWSSSIWMSSKPIPGTKFASKVYHYYHLYFYDGSLVWTDFTTKIFSARCVRTIE